MGDHLGTPGADGMGHNINAAQNVVVMFGSSRGYQSSTANAVDATIREVKQRPTNWTSHLDAPRLDSQYSKVNAAVEKLERTKTSRTPLVTPSGHLQLKVPNVKFNFNVSVWQTHPSKSLSTLGNYLHVVMLRTHHFDFDIRF